MSSVIFLVEKRQKNGDEKVADTPIEPARCGAAAEPQTHAVRDIPSARRLVCGKSFFPERLRIASLAQHYQGHRALGSPKENGTARARLKDGGVTPWSGRRKAFPGAGGGKASSI